MIGERKRAALFVGRWQPFHNGHKYIIDQALAAGKRVVIGCRDTPISDSDPYTYEQRVEMIRRVYGDRVEVMLFPDIESINVGRGVGYDINYMEAPPAVQAISATKVRSGQGQGNLPEEVEAYVKLMETTIWFTGLPCSGKTTLAKAFRSKLMADGYNVALVDGDEIRTGLCAGLGFADGGREENLRRAAWMCEMFNRNRTVVLASFVSPTKGLRDIVRGIVKNLRVVYVNCDVETCEERDVKGMYAKARAGEIRGFTGVDAPFEVPGEDENPLVLDTSRLTVAESVYELCRKFGVKMSS